MFSKTAELILESMQCRPAEYYQQIYDKFGNQTKYFNDLVELFADSNSVSTEEFIQFCEVRNIEENGWLENSLYELFKNLNLFRERGVFAVFKNRETGWLAPKVYLSRTHVPKKNYLDTLPKIVEIYRGCQESEFQNNEFTQSWTLCKETACRFAKDTYSDIPKGIVVKAFVNKTDILFYDKNDGEQEIILDLDTEIQPTLVNNFD